jgi:putative hydrolase of the HAD superfamily
MNEINDKIKKSNLIIFDLGGVLVDLDPGKTIDAFDALGLSEAARQIGSGHHGGVMADLERGLVSEVEFFDYVNSLVDHPLPVESIENAWNSMLVGLPAHRVKVVEMLKKSKKVVLLSNTNSIHHRYFDGMAQGYGSLSDLFHHTWYSYRMGLSKPDPDIFRRVIEFHGVDASETLLIDDSLLNINAAGELGMLTWHVVPGRTLENLVLS